MLPNKLKKRDTIGIIPPLKSANKILEIKKIIKKECETLGFTNDWFYDTHLLAVEKFAKKLLKKLPKADKEIVMLGVWLHDIQRIRGIEGDHAKIGAREAGKVMKKFDYNKNKTKLVKKIILTHCCNTKLMPETIEGKILASADAMSHYTNNFYLKVAISGDKNFQDYKKWALEKLNRDYNEKIYFNFAKKIIKKNHNILMSLFSIK